MALQTTQTPAAAHKVNDTPVSPILPQTPQSALKYGDFNSEFMELINSDIIEYGMARDLLRFGRSMAAKSGEKELEPLKKIVINSYESDVISAMLLFMKAMERVNAK